MKRVWSPGLRTTTRTPVQQWRSNVLWWLACTLPVLALMLLPGDTSLYTPWDALAVALGIGVALGLRHVLPMAAFLTAVTMATWTATLFGSYAPPWASLLMTAQLAVCYLIGRADSGDHRLAVQFAAMAVLIVALVPLLHIRLLEGVELTLYLVFMVVFPWLVGRYRYQHALLLTAGWERADRLEREQRAVADQARLRERTRIAEDMHDSLGHELSLIALRSAALEVDRDLPERHQEAAGELRRSAAVATERLREIIGLLRDEGESASVNPVDESVADLVERARGSGMDVHLVTEGDAATLPRMADRAAHRVVQESLTNAAKHAPGATVSVHVEHRDDHSTVTVVNDLPDGDAPSGIGGKRGLAGLSERVRLAGGTLRSGPRAGRFEVHARLPHSHEQSLDAEPDTPDTESAQRHVAERNLARRRLLTAFAVPIGILAMLGIVSVTVYYVVTSNSVMRPADYAAIQVGQSHDEVNKLLPTFQMIDPPTTSGAKHAPKGAECEYYSAKSAEYSDVYELCFVDDRLAVKHVITTQEQLEQQS
jgi:signal transduction histidine kinase